MTQGKKKRVFIALFFVIALAASLLRALPFAGQREAFVFSGPQGEVALEQGIYSAGVEYRENRHSVFSLEPGEGDRVRTGVMFLLPEQESVMGRIYVDGASATIRFHVSEAYPDSEVQVSSISFTYRRFTTMSYYFLRTLFLFLGLSGLLWFGVKWYCCGDPLTRFVMAGCFLLILCLSIPLLGDHLIGGHDSRFHACRIEAIGEGMRNGYFPVHLFGGWFRDFGYPLGVYYGDSYLYPFALLYEAGFPLWSCYRALLICVHTTTVILSYRCFARISGNRLAGFFSCVLYSGAIWYLTSVYTSNTPGASLAMAFLPLIVTGLHDVIKEEYGHGSLCLVLGFTGVIQTHVISTMMAFLFAALFCVFHWKVFLNAARMKAIGKAAGGTVLLNLYFLLPFLDYMTRYRDIAAYYYNTDSIQENGVIWQQLFSPVYNVRGHIGWDQIPDAATEMPQTTGIALLCVFVLAVWLLLRERKNMQQGAYIRTLLILSVLALFMTTLYFPYRWIMQHLPVLYSVIGRSIQFQARYFAIACVLLSTVASLCMPVLLSHVTQHRASYLICGIIVLISLVQSGAFLKQYMDSDADTPDFAPYTGANFDGYTDNLYVRIGVNTDLKDAAVGDDNDLVEVTGTQRKGFSFVCETRNTTDEIQELSFPVWAYHGYRAYGVTNDSEERMEVGENSEFRAVVPLPPAFEGEVRLEWEKPWYWLAAELVSFVTLILLIVHRKRKGEDLT